MVMLHQPNELGSQPARSMKVRQNGAISKAANQIAPSTWQILSGVPKLADSGPISRRTVERWSCTAKQTPVTQVNDLLYRT